MTKIELNKNEIANALKIVMPAIKSRTVIPIIAHVLIEPMDGKIKLTTTDMQVRIETYCNAVSTSGEKFSIDANKFSNAVSKSSNDKITIESDEKNAILLKSGNFKLKSAGIDLSDFPLAENFTETNSFNIESSELVNAISKVSYAVSLDDTRKALHGVLFDCKDNSMSAVATDGKRVSIYNAEIKNNTCETSLIAPLNTVNIVKNIVGNISVKSTNSEIVFSNEITTISSKLIDATYPNYKQIIPQKLESVIVVDSNEIMSCLDTVTIINAEYIEMIFSNNKIMFNAISAGDDVSDEMEIDYSNDDVRISANAQFVKDIVRRVDNNNFELSLIGENNPVRVDSGNCTCVFMPLRNK